MNIIINIAKMSTSEVVNRYHTNNNKRYLLTLGFQLDFAQLLASKSTCGPFLGTRLHTPC